MKHQKKKQKKRFPLNFEWRRTFKHEVNGKIINKNTNEFDHTLLKLLHADNIETK